MEGPGGIKGGADLKTCEEKVRRKMQVGEPWKAPSLNPQNRAWRASMPLVFEASTLSKWWRVMQDPSSQRVAPEHLLPVRLAECPWMRSKLMRWQKLKIFWNQKRFQRLRKTQLMKKR